MIFPIYSTVNTHDEGSLHGVLEEMTITMSIDCGRGSPRARTLLFMFLRPKGLRVVSKVEFSVVFRNVILTKIRPCINAQTSFEHGHLHNMILMIFYYSMLHSRHFIFHRNTSKAPIHQYEVLMKSSQPLLCKEIIHDRILHEMVQITGLNLLETNDK